MWMDVVDLRDFYATPLGRTGRRLVTRRLRHLWPDVTGQRVLGFGFATPYLDVFRSEAERVLAAMPAQQGVLHWPREGPCGVLLTEESAQPFADVSIDRVLMVHALEYSEALRPLLREIWRIMTPGGRLLIVVPNRRGLWAYRELTPFGHGHPFSPRQLSALLRDTMFTPLNQSCALFVPPTKGRMVLAGAEAWERIGERWFSSFGGVTVVEAGKQVYAGTAVPAAPTRRASLAKHPMAHNGLSRSLLQQEHRLFTE